MSFLLVPLTLLCLSVWVVVAGPRLGRLLAVPAVGGALLLAATGLLLVTPLVAVPLGIVVLIALALATALGLLLSTRNGSARRRPSRAAAALWLPATVGALGWLAVRAVAAVLPDASRVSWARSEERRVGKECIAVCRSRWSPYH